MRVVLFLLHLLGRVFDVLIESLFTAYAALQEW